MSDSTPGTTKHHFCTFANYGYLDRALVMINSMRQHVSPFTLEVLCFDDTIADFFTTHSFPEVRCINLAEFEARNPDLVAIKATRTQSEYFFTCTPAFICDVFGRTPDLDIVTYLDADMVFYSSLDPVLKKFEDKSIMIAEHCFTERELDSLKFGRFNAGWASFRNNEIGKKCLSRWRTQCIEWCFDRLESGKFGDQKYLDEWPDLYKNQVFIASPAINCGPWGLTKNPLKQVNDTLMVGDQVLVAYHFQGLRVFSKHHFYLGYYFSFFPIRVMELLYYPYVKNLISTVSQYKLSAAGQQQRYASGTLLYKLATGYWVDKPLLSYFVWVVQRYILRLG